MSLPHANNPHNLSLAYNTPYCPRAFKSSAKHTSPNQSRLLENDYFSRSKMDTQKVAGNSVERYMARYVLLFHGWDSRLIYDRDDIFYFGCDQCVNFQAKPLPADLMDSNNPVVALLSQMRVNLGISPQLLTVVGTILGLVVSFRTSSAYDRYGEGMYLTWRNG